MHDGITIGQRKAAEQLVERLLAASVLISVHDGGEWAIKRSNDKAAILDAMGNTDSDTLALRFPHDPGKAPTGSIFLVWGNTDDGSDLVSDYCPATGTVDDLIHAHWEARGDI